MDLDEVRFKQPEELNDGEKSFLKENEANLIEEEKEIFKSVLHPEEFTTVPVEGSPPVVTPPATTVPPTVPETPPAPTEGAINFKTEAELDAWLEKRDQKRFDDAERVKVAKAEEDAEKTRLAEQNKDGIKFFEEDYKPNDWNEFANVFMKVALPVFSQEIGKMTETQKEKYQAQVAAVDDAFTKETDLLKTEGKEIPEEGTPERVELDKELAKISLEFGIVDTDKPMHKAFEIYEYRKGKVTSPAITPPAVTPPPVKTPPTTDLAKKVGTSPNANPTTPKKSYKDVQSKTMDQIMEANGF